MAPKPWFACQGQFRCVICWSNHQRRSVIWRLIHGLVNATLPSASNSQGGGGGRTVPRANRIFACGALRAHHRQALGSVRVCCVLLASVSFALLEMGLVRCHGARALVPLVPRLDRPHLSAPHRDRRRRRCAEEKSVRKASTHTHHYILCTTRTRGPHHRGATAVPLHESESRRVYRYTIVFCFSKRQTLCSTRLYRVIS